MRIVCTDFMLKLEQMFFKDFAKGATSHRVDMHVHHNTTGNRALYIKSQFWVVIFFTIFQVCWVLNYSQCQPLYTLPVLFFFGSNKNKNKHINNRVTDNDYIYWSYEVWINNDIISSGTISNYIYAYDRITCKY